MPAGGAEALTERGPPADEVAAAVPEPRLDGTMAEEAPHGAHPPPGTDGEVAVPEAEPPPPRVAGVTESLLPAPAPGQDHVEVRDLDAPQATRAGERTAASEEEAAYLRALARNDASGYGDFLEKFPASPRRDEVEARLRVAKRRP